MSHNPELELLQSLQSENKDLRDLVVSLSATLLRHILAQSGQFDRPHLCLILE